MSAQILMASVAIILAAFACPGINAEYDVATYCQLVPVGTKFPSFQSCQTYYVCQANNQYTTAYCTGTSVFNKDVQDCVSASSYNCYYNVADPCENKDGTWVPDSKDCTIWHYCSQGTIAGSGSCPYGQYFDGTAGMCVNGKCPNSGGSTQITSLCQIMQSGQFFGDLDNCAAWHRCSGIEIHGGTCEAGLIYNAEERMCLDSNGNMCAGPTEVCNEAAENNIVANPSVCSEYFQCTQSNNKWLWKRIQCSAPNYYDVNTKNCQNRQTATPAKGCNRCQYTSETFVNAVDPSCRGYLTCKNGNVVGQGNCPADDGFFNEQGQMCMNDNQALPEYRKSNGACYVESVAPPTSAPATTAEPTPDQPVVTKPATDNPAGPGETTKKPEETPTDKPVETTEKPVTTTEKPETTTEKPETTTEKPETTTEKPAADTE